MRAVASNLKQNSSMKNIFLIGFLFFINQALFSQTKILKSFDFDKHDYRFYFIYQYNDMRLEDSLEVISHFMINDKTELKKLQESWISTTEVEGILDCGYDWEIYVVENEKIVSNLNVNTDCGQVITYGIGESYNFKGNPFLSLKRDKLVNAYYIETDTITKTRELYSQIVNTDSVYYPSEQYESWMKYNGQFHFIITAKDTKNGLRLAKNIKKDIYKKHPSGNFEIDFWGYNKFRLDGYIYCDSSVVEKFSSDSLSWGDFNFYFGKTGWEPWSKTAKEYFSAFIFSDNIVKLDKIIKTAGNT